MKRKRHRPEQIIRKLRDGDRMLSEGNYNACQLGESQPITVKYSDRIGEILLANPEVPREKWRHNFKYYIFEPAVCSQSEGVMHLACSLLGLAIDEHDA